MTTRSNIDEPEYTSTDMPEIKHRSWKSYSTLIGGFFLLMYPGSIYITGNLAPYISCYFNVSQAKVSNLLLTNMILNPVFLPIGTYFSSRGTNPKLLIVIGACIGLPLMWIASCCQPDQWSAFAWLYPLSFCTNGGLTYFCACCEAWKFFPDKPGLASGISLAGIGCGAFIFDNISTALINPDDVKVGTPEFKIIVNERFVYMLRWLIFWWGCLVLFGFAMIWKAPANLTQKIQELKKEEDKG